MYDAEFELKKTAELAISSAVANRVSMEQDFIIFYK